MTTASNTCFFVLLVLCNAGLAVGGTVIVGTDPQGATVWLDGQEIGQTPLEVGGLPDGRSYDVSVHKAGYGYYSERIEAAPGEAQVVLIAMKRAEALGDRLADVATGRLAAVALLCVLAVLWGFLAFGKLKGWAFLGAGICLFAAGLELLPVLLPDLSLTAEIIKRYTPDVADLVPIFLVLLWSVAGAAPLVLEERYIGSVAIALLGGVLMGAYFLLSLQHDTTVAIQVHEAIGKLVGS